MAKGKKENKNGELSNVEKQKPMTKRDKEDLFNKQKELIGEKQKQSSEEMKGTVM